MVLAANSGKLVSFAPGTRNISRNAKRYKKFYDRKDEVHAELKRERAIERGELVILRVINEEVHAEDVGSPQTLGLTLPPAALPASSFIQPPPRLKRRVRSRRPKVEISPTSMDEPVPQTPNPPSTPPDTPLSPPAPPPTPLNSAGILSDTPSSSSKPTSFLSRLSALATSFVPAAITAKKQSYFEKFAALRQVMEEAMRRGTFSFAEFRRRHRNVTVFAEDPTIPLPASSMKVREMFNAEFCGHGDEPLPKGEVALNLASMDRYHVSSCIDCSAHGEILDDCYWSKLRLCVACGLKPQLVSESSGVPTPLYEGNGAEGNHASASFAFPRFTQSQVAKLLQRGAIEKCAPEDIGVFSPLGVTVPSSRRRQARTLTGIDARDDDSYEAAEAALEAQGRTKVLKRRMVQDLRGSGFNDECVYQPFQYVRIDDAIELITKDCFFAICDVDSYYYHFPIAQGFRRHLGFVFEGQCYRFTSLPFGLSPAPRLASTFTAENVQSVKAQGAPCVAMIDDYLTTGRDIEEALRNQRIMESTLTNNGFILSESKRVGPVQQAVFIGVKLDSVNMTQSVNPASADLFKNSLEVYIEILEQGGELTGDVTRHMCGVLENWAQMCQEGRDRAYSSWQYLCYGPDLWPACRVRLLDDLRWWSAQATLWAAGDAAGCYPLVTGEYLSKHPEAVHVSVTDFSGTDGIGGISGLLSNPNPEYFSVSQDESMRGVSSFDGELMALRHVLLEEEARSLDPTREQPSVPVIVELWLTDNRGAAESINGGRCREESGRALLRDIFAIAARLRRTLLAVWQPRESNTDADKLSHYAALLGVSQTQGYLSDLPSWVTGGVAEASSQGSGETDRIQAKCEGSESTLQPLHRFPRDVQPYDGFRCGGDVFDPLHADQQWAHGFAGRGSQSSTDAAREEQPAFLVGFGEREDQGAYRALPQGGPYPGASSSCIAHSYRPRDYQDHGFGRSGAAYESDPASYSSPGSSPRGGNYQSPPGREFCIQGQRTGSGHPYPPHQDLFNWGGGVCGVMGQQQRDLGVQIVGPPFRKAWSPQETHGSRFLHDPKGSAIPRQALFKGGFHRAD